MMNRNHFAVFSTLLAILVTTVLIYIDMDQYAGYALFAGFVSMVLVTPDSKKPGDACQVVGSLVDGVDLSFMGDPVSYTQDIKRCREHFCNTPGAASKMPWARARYLVENWRKSKGKDGGAPTPPPKHVLLWRKVKAFFLQPVPLPKWLKKAEQPTES